MVAKRFFYVCAGLLCLAAAYHLGARNAGAQAPGNSVVALLNDPYGPVIAATANGDIYLASPGQNDYSHWRLSGNVFSGPTPAQTETLGRLKARYRTGGER